MPKIKNKRYLKHFKKKQIELISPKEFYENWRKIKALPHLQNLLKDFFLLLFWTGRRPVELLNLRGENFTKTQYKEKDGMFKDYFVIDVETKKGGNDVEIQLVFEQLPEFDKLWNRIQGCPPEFRYFELLRTRGTDTLNWETKEGEPRNKTYEAPSKKIWYWSNKYFDVPPYFFRHNRFSTMVIGGATLQDLKFFKGAKTIASVEPYISPDKETMRRLGQGLGV